MQSSTPVPPPPPPPPSTPEETLLHHITTQAILLLARFGVPGKLIDEAAAELAVSMKPGDQTEVAASIFIEKNKVEFAIFADYGKIKGRWIEIPEEEFPYCPGCAGDLAGLVDVICAPCRRSVVDALVDHD